jgi:hypothetical protein
MKRSVIIYLHYCLLGCVTIQYGRSSSILLVSIYSYRVEANNSRVQAAGYMHDFFCLLLAWCTHFPSRWRQHVPLIWWWVSARLQSVTSKKIVVFF